jgi:hemoglobin-like flavoprotein
MATTEQTRAERATANRAETIRAETIRAETVRVEATPAGVLETEATVTEVLLTGAIVDRGAGSTEPVTAGQRWLVQTSWDKVVPMAPHVAELFYDRLFELDPLLEDLFPANLSEQGTELMAAIGLAVARLEQPSSIAPGLEELSRRHVGYGLRTGHYVTIGDALIWTLEQSLAEDFTPRVKEAWAAAYQLFSALMIEADAATRRSQEPGSSVRRTVAAPAREARRAG